MGISSDSMDVVRDCLFAFYFNSLRDSSVISIESFNFTFTSTSLTCLLLVVKGPSASSVELVRYTKHGHETSPLDIWERLMAMRGEHVRFFEIPGDSVVLLPQFLDSALQRILVRFSLNAPRSGKYS